MEIKLTKGQIAIIDDEDLEVIGGPEGWYTLVRATGDFHAARNRGKFVYMHQLILGKKEGFQIDHIDGNGLNNRKSNLRYVTKSQNQRNRHRTWGNSKYKGVCYMQKIKTPTWRAAITKEKDKTTHIGCYRSPEAAARAYDIEAIKSFGEHVKTNFPLEQYAWNF